MRDFGLVAAGMVFGRLTSKTWERPRCQLGLVVFLVATAQGLRVGASRAMGAGVMQFATRNMNLHQL